MERCDLDNSEHRTVDRFKKLSCLFSFHRISEFLLLGLLLISVSYCSASKSSEECIAFQDVTLIDGNASSPKPHSTVIVRGNRIEAISSSATPVTDCSRTFQSGGKYLIPGLWDMHTHGTLYGEGALGLSVRAGVTTILDLGSDLPEVDKWIEEVNKEARIGPRIFRSGPLIHGPGVQEKPRSGRISIMVEGMEDAQGVVRTLKQAGVNVISIHQDISKESFRGLAAESRIQGLPLMVSIPGTMNAGELVQAGADCIVDVETILAPDGTLPQEWISKMVEKHTCLIPSLISYRRNTVEMQKTREEFQAMQDILQKYVAGVGEMHKAGVRILAGTGYGWQTIRTRPGYDLHNEMFLLVKAGLTPMEALQSATKLPALFLKASDSGTIEIGKRADLVLLSANPLENISNIRKVLAVVQNGHLYAGKRK